MGHKTSSCGLCHYEFNIGAYVCQGCRGDITYGATSQELAEASKMGFIIFGIVGFALVYVLPMLFNKYLSMHLGDGWGLGFYGLVLVAASAGFGAYKFRSGLLNAEASTIRTFRR